MPPFMRRSWRALVHVLCKAVVHPLGSAAQRAHGGGADQGATRWIVASLVSPPLGDEKR
jgi:hypothetical protein